MLVTIQDIYRQTKKLSGLEEVKIRGWAKSSIRQKKFVDLNDGSCLPNLQVVFSPSLAEKIKKINFGSGLIIKGKLILTPERAQTCELQAQEIEFISLTESDYPLQKQIIPLRVVRDYPHLRAKTNYFLALFRLRHSISKTIHDFFNQEEFYYVSTPIITSNDTEGISKMFNITTKKKSSFFSKIGKLTVSGQLQAEALAQGLGRVYTFSPCFRAEDSHTTHHLAEF